MFISNWLSYNFCYDLKYSIVTYEFHEYIGNFYELITIYHTILYEAWNNFIILSCFHTALVAIIRQVLFSYKILYMTESKGLSFSQLKISIRILILQSLTLSALVDLNLTVSQHGHSLNWLIVCCWTSSCMANISIRFRTKINKHRTRILLSLKVTYGRLKKLLQGFLTCRERDTLCTANRI